jgi:hypothetical protein
MMEEIFAVALIHFLCKGSFVMIRDKIVGKTASKSFARESSKFTSPIFPVIGSNGTLCVPGSPGLPNALTLMIPEIFPVSLFLAFFWLSTLHPGILNRS